MKAENHPGEAMVVQGRRDHHVLFSPANTDEHLLIESHGR
jgi:hypothetical protein